MDKVDYQCKPKIFLPSPHSTDLEYCEANIPNYVNAIEASGGVPVIVHIHKTPLSEIEKIFADCDGAVLPGSPADVDPSLYGQSRHAETNPSDATRFEVDKMVYTHSLKTKKPTLSICYGTQSLNVIMGGSLVQHVYDHTSIHHTAGATIMHAHTIRIKRHSKLLKAAFSKYKCCCENNNNGHAERSSKHKRKSQGTEHADAAIVTIIDGQESCDCDVEECDWLTNSSHHQSVDRVGNGLRAVAFSCEDNIVEAIELAHEEDGSSPHFMLGVQWHPERFFHEDHLSQGIFQQLIEAATKYKRQAAEKENSGDT